MKDKFYLKIIKVPRKPINKSHKIEIFLFDTHIAGTAYVEGIEELAENLTINERLNFVREENNKYDLQAIKIQNSQGNKLGYVPQVDNVIFARLMDHGKVIFAKVRKIELRGKWYKIDIAVFLEEGGDIDENINSWGW